MIIFQLSNLKLGKRLALHQTKKEVSLQKHKSMKKTQQQPFFSWDFCAIIGKASLSGWGGFLGSFFAISINRGLTLLAFFADVSINKIPCSSAYAFASSNSTLRRDSRSALLPAWIMMRFYCGGIYIILTNAITTLGSPLLCNSFTHPFAPAKDSGLVISYTTIAAAAPR